MSSQAALLAKAIALKQAAAIPLYTSASSLTWVLHDYLITVEDEARYIWSGPWNLGKILFFWVRYYTIAALVFDVAQIHSFSKFQPSLDTCVVMDAMIRVVGALSLWGVEIVMQLRIYALFRLDKRVAIFNAVVFLGSIAGFLWILIHNALVRASVIASAKALPIPGCPVVHTGIEWAQWVPATAYEGILFGFALWKAGENLMTGLRAKNSGSIKSWRPTLYSVVISDNLLYFFFIAGILVFNNLMVVSLTHIPWFSYGPFHAATGIMTSRMLIHVRKTLLKQNAQGSGRSERTSRYGPPSVDIGSGQWQAAAGSSSGGTTTLNYSEDSYELKSRASRAVRIVDISSAGLENHKGKDVEAAPLTSIGTYSEPRGPDSPA